VTSPESALAFCPPPGMLAPLLAAALLLSVSQDVPPAPPPDAPVLPPTAVAQLPSARPPPTGRAERIAIELLVAGGTGVGVGALGGYFGCLATPASNGQTCSISTIAAVGLTSYGLTVAALVPLAGQALGGDGLLWVSWLGEAAGLGAGLGLAQGNAKNAMFFAAPLMLVGAIVGYELTAGWGGPQRASTSVLQAVALQPAKDGVVLAVGGRF
jgi:hypothetical protein